VLVGVASCYKEGRGQGQVKSNIHEYRIRSQNLHIDDILKDVEELEEEYAKLSPLPEKDEITHLKARVRNLEHADCEAGHVPCGGDVPECVNHLFVCDGHDDCKNGHDEDDETCSDEPYKVGSSLAGITTWKDCFTHLPHMTVITITANDKDEHFTPRIGVKAVVSMEVDEHSHLVKSLNLKGYFNRGKRVLVLVPENAADRDTVHGHAIVCRFNLGDDHTADCTIGAIASRHVCATFRGGRGDDD
jgi:hypothetical protein